MSTQPGIQAPPQSSSGKKWFMGCGIALLIVLLVGGGMAFWVAKKAKDFANEWGNNPSMMAIGMVFKFDDSYEVLDKDPEAGTLRVREVASGEESLWTLSKLEEGAESIEITDDKGRTIIIGGSSGRAFTIIEPDEEDSVAEPVVEEQIEETEEVVE